MPVHLREDRDFRLDVDELAKDITDRTKLIIINSPQNPTGGVMTKEDVQDLAAAIGDRDIMVLSDEIYHRLLFEGEHYSIAAVDGFKDRTIILDGFSKTYAMTGWRMGYGVMRPDLATHIARLMTNSNSCTATFTQVAGIEALRGDQSEVEKMRQEFEHRRNVFVNGINKIKGFSCRLPKGAFYAFPEHQGDRLAVEETGRRAAGRGGSGCAVGNCVRGVRRGIFAVQRGQFDREYPDCARAH